MAENDDEFGGETVYVKETGRGLRERRATTPTEHVNLRAKGWSVKGSKGAPKGKPAKIKSEGDSDEAASSIRAHTDGEKSDK